MAESAWAPTMPAEFERILRHAAASGNVDEVSFCFEGLDADFPAPIGWMVHLVKVSGETLIRAGIDPDAMHIRDSLNPTEHNHLIVSAQVNSTTHAYLGIHPETRAAAYLGVDGIISWIDAPRPEGTGAPESIPDEHVEIVVAGAHRGRNVSQRITRYPDIGGITVPATVAYRFEAVNWFYNDPTSPYHRDAGDGDTPVSHSVSIGRSVDESSFSWGLDGTERVNPSDLINTVTQGQPAWWAPVAHFDEETEEWVIPQPTV